VYLKERVAPVAKKGTVQNMQLVKIREQPTNEYELRAIAQEILERAKRDPDGFIEIEKRGITVVQIGSMRIAIARRPFSDGMEITAVRPIVHVSLDDYNKADVLKARLTGNRRGLIIAGSPGSGKTTLAQSIATYLAGKGQVVKTMEAPRGLREDHARAEHRDVPCRYRARGKNDGGPPRAPGAGQHHPVHGSRWQHGEYR
jgi:ATPase